MIRGRDNRQCIDLSDDMILGADKSGAGDETLHHIVFDSAYAHLMIVQGLLDMAGADHVGIDGAGAVIRLS